MSKDACELWNWQGFQYYGGVSFHQRTDAKVGKQHCALGEK